MNNIDNVLAVTIVGLISYIVHSSVLLCIATACQHIGILRSLRLAEKVWRFALFGGLFSSLLVSILWANSQSTTPVATSTQTSSPRLAHTDDQARNQSNKAPLESIATDDLSTPSQVQSAGAPFSNTDISAATSEPRKLTSTPNSAPAAATWEIPRNVKQLTWILLSAWLLYVGFILGKTYISVRYLHRLAASLPLVERADLQELLQALAPQANISIRVCHHSTWSSPFACPDGTICMPAWALQDVDPQQTYAMLTHEVQHVLRADGQWRIAQQLMISILFFQPLNRYANHHLQLLAEIDCDYSAIQNCSVENYSRSLLRCAEMYYANTPPIFASSMAKPSSLLRRINLLFNEDAMHKLISVKHTKQANFGVISVGLLAIFGLSGISIAMPAIHFAGELVPAITSTVNTPTIVKSGSNIYLPLTETTYLGETTLAMNAATESPAKTIAITPNKLVTLANQVDNHLSTSHTQSIDLERAQAAYQSKDFPLALQLFKDLAKNGHAEAQFAAGEMLWLGEGEKINPEAAVSLLTQAAKQGHTRAQSYIDLFAQRAQHQTELNYLTQNFDGGKLKWTEQTCARPTLSSELPSAKEYNDFINKLNANLNCYNNYVASLKKSLANEDYLDADLRRLMRIDEIEQSKHLVQNIYFDMGTQAMQYSQQILAEFDKKNEAWRSEIKTQSARQVALNDAMVNAHFARMERRQVEVETGTRNTITSTNPNASPNIK